MGTSLVGVRVVNGANVDAGPVEETNPMCLRELVKAIQSDGELAEALLVTAKIKKRHAGPFMQTTKAAAGVLQVCIRVTNHRSNSRMRAMLLQKHFVRLNLFRLQDEQEEATMRANLSFDLIAFSCARNYQLRENARK